MLKRTFYYCIVIYCFGVLCLKPALATTKQHIEQNTAREFIINAECFKNMMKADLELIHRGTLVGNLKIENNNITLKGLGEHSFYISELPKLISLQINSGASLTIDSPVEAELFIAITTGGTAKLKKGFKIDSAEGVAIFKGADFLFDGHSYVNGIFRLEADKFTNAAKAHMKLGQGELIVGNARNLGKIEVLRSLSVAGAWQNDSKGVVVIGQHFSGHFSKYQDDGSTTVQGLASIHADHGRITGSFLARYGMIVFKGSLLIPKSSTFTIQDHLTLHSHANLELHGTISLKQRKDWLALEISAQLREKIRGLSRGLFISAKENLSKKGNVTSDNTSIQYFAGKKFEGTGGLNRSGFFDKNNIIIIAASASLADEIRSYNDFNLKVKFAELLGKRKIDNRFLLDVEQLKQYKNDNCKASSVAGRAENATLAGYNELAQGMSLYVQDTFKTESSFQLKNGMAFIQTQHADLAGRFKDVNLLVEARGDIKLKNSFDADVNMSCLNGDRIVHESGSKLMVAENNHEIAKKSIDVEKGASLKAHNNNLKADSYIYNSGSIESDNNYFADTKRHFNIDGGRIKAKQATIYADEFNLNHMADWDTQNSEINTLVNINNFGRMRGRDSLKVNALLADFGTLGGIYQSNNYVSNSLLYANKYGLRVRDVPDLSAGIDYKLWAQRALSAGAMLCTGSALLCINGIQRSMSLYDFAAKTYQKLNEQNSEDDHNYWRLSRIAKNTGGYLEYAISANEAFKDAQWFDKTYAKLYSPEKTNNSEDKQDNNKSLKPLSKEDIIESLTDMTINAIKGRMTVNSAWSYDDGYNFMPHVNRRSIFDYDYSRSAALVKNVSAYSAIDRSIEMSYRNTTTVEGDLIVGSTKYVVDSYTAKSGGNVVVEANFSSNAANNSVSANGAMAVKEGAEASGGTVSFTSKSDMDYAGKAHATSDVLIYSAGKQIVRESAHNTGHDVLVLSKGDQAYAGKADATGIALVKSEGVLTVTNSAANTGKKVVYHGESNDFGGKGTASELVSTTSGTGSYTLRSTAEVDAPCQIVGSGYSEKAENGLLPIEEAGPVTIEPGAKIKGNGLDFRGQNVPDLIDLAQQTGRYSDFKISDYVKVETDQEVVFKESMNPASKGFELHTNKISVDPGVSLKALTLLILDSTKEDMTLGHGVTFGAGVYLEVLSDKDIIGDFEKILIRDKKGRIIGAKFEGVNFVGGSGIEYEYEDPETGEKSIRKIGLNIDAKGQVKGTGMKFTAGSDTRVFGSKGVINKGVSQIYLHHKEKERNFWRKKSKKYYETEYFMPAVSTPGKIIIASDEGGLEWHAGGFDAGDGADILMSKDVEFKPIKGKTGHITKRKSKIKILDSYDDSLKDLETTTICINQGTSKVRIWAVDKDGNRQNIIAPGFKYSGTDGTLQLKGRDGYFSRSILNNSSHSTKARASLDYALIAHMKSFQALESIKDAVHNISQSDRWGALKDIVQPSVNFGVDLVSTYRNFQSLGDGGIATFIIEWDFIGDVHQNNAYSIYIKNGGSIKIAGTWYQNGAKLKLSSESNSFGLFAGVNGNGPSGGFRLGHSKTKGHTWEFGQNNSDGPLHLEVGKIEQNGFEMNVNHATGHVGTIISRTPQDKSSTTGFGISIDILQKNASVNVHHNRTRQTNNKSGVHFASVSEDFSIDEAQLTGAKITGVVPTKTTYKRLPKDEDWGVSGGINVNAQGLSQVNIGVAKDGHELSLSLNTQKSPAKEGQLLSSAGTISYYNDKLGIHLNGVPIVTGVNYEAWREFGRDIDAILPSTKNNINRSPVVDYTKDNIEPEDALEYEDKETRTELIDEIEGQDCEDLFEPKETELALEDAKDHYEFDSADLTIAALTNKDDDQNDDNFHGELSGLTFDNLLGEIERVLNIAKEPILVMEFPINDDNGESLGENVVRALVTKLRSIPFSYQTIQGSLVAPELVLLKNPVVFDKMIFSYQIEGTNCFLQDVSQLESVLEARRTLGQSPSKYVQNSYSALHDPELACFFYNSAELPTGDLGRHSKFKIPKYEGGTVSVATQMSGQDTVAVINVHEGAHHHQRLLNESYEPGYVAGDPELSLKNRQSLLRAFSEDAQGQGFKKLSALPKGTSEECFKMFQGPWTYFENTLSKTMQGLGFSEKEIALVIKQAEQDILKGHPPTSILHEYPTGCGAAFDAAEEILAIEIRPLSTEAEFNMPGIAKKLAPQTDAMLDVLDAPHQKRMNPTAYKHKLLGIVKIALPFADWGLHVGVELYNGKNVPEAVVDGTIKTGIDTAVYTPIIWNLAKNCGKAPALGFGALCFAAEFVPDVSKEFRECHVQMRAAEESKNASGYFKARCEAEQLGRKMAFKCIFTFPRHVSEWIFEKFDNNFPTLRPAASEFLEDAAVKYIESCEQVFLGSD